MKNLFKEGYFFIGMLCGIVGYILVGFLFPVNQPTIIPPTQTPEPTTTPTIIPPTETPIPTITNTPIPTQTPEPTATFTPTPMQPFNVNETVLFSGVDDDHWTLVGTVVFSEYRNSLSHDFWGTEYPEIGVFAVLIIDVTNLGLVENCVSFFSSLAAISINDPVYYYNMAGLKPGWAAQQEYGYEGTEYNIQPGSTERLVVVFDVPVGSEYLSLFPLDLWEVN